MAHIVYVWELGGNLGHLTSFSRLARVLKSRGHRVSLAVRQIEGVAQFFSHDEVRVYQAPLALSLSPRDFVPRTWAEILYRSGFANADSLSDLLRAWRSLWDAIEPDLLIFNFAAVSTLAARALRVPTAHLGVGYSLPPKSAPLPAIQPRATLSEAARRALEAPVVEVAQAALRRLGLPPIVEAHEICATGLELLCSFRELDHYPGRSGGRYHGALFELDAELAPEWPAGDEPKLFVYAQPNGPYFEALLSGLRSSGLRTLMACPAASAAFVERYSSRTLRIEPRAVSIRQAREQAALMVCPGGQGTMAAFLLAGVPVLAAPNHQEQAVQAGVAQLSGVGVATLPPEGDIARLLNAAMRDDALRGQARAFAARYLDFSTELQAQVLCDELERHLRGESVSSEASSAAWRNQA